MTTEKIEELHGLTMASVRNHENESLVFMVEDGRAFEFYHMQDCCENVTIEDICGDLDDLRGSPILEATETIEEGGDQESDSATWTFYRFATVKGTVTVRWFGESNGYYSESVDFREIKKH